MTNKAQSQGKNRCLLESLRTHMAAGNQKKGLRTVSITPRRVSRLGSGGPGPSMTKGVARWMPYSRITHTIKRISRDLYLFIIDGSIPSPGRNHSSQAGPQLSSTNMSRTRGRTAHLHKSQFPPDLLGQMAHRESRTMYSRRTPVCGLPHGSREHTIHSLVAYWGLEQSTPLSPVALK